MRARMIWFAFFVVVLDAMGIGLLMPVLPDILEELTGGSISQTAKVAMWLTAAYAGMQFLFGPLIGNLSDRFGRRPVLLISIFALGLVYIFLAIAPTVLLLFVGRIIAGIAGATQSTAMAVAADLSDEDKRAQTMGLVFAGFGLFQPVPERRPDSPQNLESPLRRDPAAALQLGHHRSARPPVGGGR